MAARPFGRGHSQCQDYERGFHSHFSPESHRQADCISQWGYDAQVANFFDKASQSSIFDHAQQLLQDISMERSRPEEVSIISSV